MGATTEGERGAKDKVGIHWDTLTGEVGNRAIATLIIQIVPFKP